MREQVEVIACDRCKVEIEDHTRTYHGVAWDKAGKEDSHTLVYAKERSLGDLCAKCYCISLERYKDKILKTNQLTAEDLENYPPQKTGE